MFYRAIQIDPTHPERTLPNLVSGVTYAAAIYVKGIPSDATKAELLLTFPEGATYAFDGAKGEDGSWAFVVKENYLATVGTLTYELDFTASDRYWCARGSWRVTDAKTSGIVPVPVNPEMPRNTVLRVNGQAADEHGDLTLDVDMKPLEGVTLSPKTLGDLLAAVKTIASALGATVAALMLAALPCRAASVTTNSVSDLAFDATVVTAVDVSDLVTTNALAALTINDLATKKGVHVVTNSIDVSGAKLTIDEATVATHQDLWNEISEHDKDAQAHNALFNNTATAAKTRIANAAIAATNYANSVAIAATNYTDSATASLASKSYVDSAVASVDVTSQLADYAKTAALTEAAKAGTNYTDSVKSSLSTSIATKADATTVSALSTTVSGKADASDVTALQASVAAWASYWSGDDVRLTITNYNSATQLPALSIAQKLTDATGGTNYFETVWDELTRWTKFLEGYASVTNRVEQDLADRAWGVYDSATGKYSPDDVLQISQPTIVIFNGLSYQQTVTTSGGSVWVLMANDTTLAANPTNGYFKVSNSLGESLFEVVNNEKVAVGATASAVSSDGSSLTVTYSVESETHPTLYYTLDLASAWIAETDTSLATVEWSGSSGAWVATVTPANASKQLFAQATYEAGGESYIKNGLPVSLTQIVIGTKTYTVDVGTIDDQQVLILK